MVVVVARTRSSKQPRPHSSKAFALGQKTFFWEEPLRRMRCKSRLGARCFSSYSAEARVGSAPAGTQLKDISVSSSSFPDIRENDLVYVDKTESLAQLLRPKSQIFLSRPRKFGKSMLLSTLQSVFMENGPKKDALFKGLWVADKSPVLLTKELPVLSLDFSTLNLEEGGQELKKSLL